MNKESTEENTEALQETTEEVIVEDVSRKLLFSFLGSFHNNGGLSRTRLTRK